MSTATIRDVELVSVGTWAASTGVTTVTRADLDSCLAAHADGLVDHAPIKLGHASPLNDDLGDGAPAYGWVVPTRIGRNAAGLDTLYGDLVGIPAKLAEVAPAAYRRRSVEIAWNVKTAQGKTYAAALVGVALLGAQAPAVKGLADVLALYSGTPDVERTTALELVDGLEDNPVAVAMLAAARRAGATVAAVDAMAAAAGARDTADVPPPVTDDDNDDNEHRPEERTTMTDEELRAALNLEQDADVDTALRGILEERGTASPGEPGEQPPAETPPAETPPVEQPAETPTETPAEREPELVTLSAATHAELTRLAAESRERRRNDALDNAIRAGRIAPAERDAFAAQLARDEEGTLTLLSTLAPRFAVTEFGADAAPDNDAAADAFDQFEADTFPGLAR